MNDFTSKEIKAISRDSFAEKKSQLNKRFKEIKLRIVEERNEKIIDVRAKLDKKIDSEKTPFEKRRLKSKRRRKIKVLKNEYKKTLAKARYKYTLLTNAFRNQELYRRGILESEIEKARKGYNKKYREAINFDKDKEKEKLSKKIKSLRKKYSRPVSTHYRKNRVSTFANKTDIANLRVPSANPYIRYTKIVLAIIFASFLTTLALDIFYKPFGLYNAGLRGITQIFFYIIQNNNPNAPQWYSYALFFGINTPLFIWSWFKIGKKFTLYTLIYLIAQNIVSILLGYSTLYEHIKPFGLTPQEIINDRQGAAGLDDIYQYAIIFISAIIASIFYGIGVGLVYKAGGSTGGSKFIVTFLGAKKNKSVGFYAKIFGIFVIFLGLTINKLIIDGNSFLDSYASTALFASLVFVFLSNYFLDMTFNKARKIKMELFTEKKQEIQYFLDYYLMYDKSYTVDKVKKGHSGDKRYKIEMILHPSEASRLKRYFKTLDSHAYIVESEITRVSGRFFNSWFE